MSRTAFANGQLRSLIDRVLRLKAEQDDLSADVSEVYKEAGSAGFDKNAMRAVVNRIRKEEKNGPGMLEQADAMTELYLAAYRGAPEDRQEVAEGNHTSPDAEGTQRPPLPRGGASEQIPRAGALVRVRGEAGEDASPPVSPASDPHDLTLPSFLDRRRRGSVEAAE